MSLPIIERFVFPTYLHLKEVSTKKCEKKCEQIIEHQM